MQQGYFLKISFTEDKNIDKHLMLWNHIAVLVVGDVHGLCYQDLVTDIKVLEVMYGIHPGTCFAFIMSSISVTLVLEFSPWNFLYP